jgi:acyl carrier protein
MNIQEIRPALVKVFADYSDDPQNSDKLEDLDIDSLDLVELTMSVEDKFNIEISDDEMDALTTFGDLLVLVTNRLNP